MKKYSTILNLLLRGSWMKAMEYRANFITWMLVDIGWTIIDFIFFGALIGNIQFLGNWNLAQAMIVIGVFRIMVVPVWGWMFQSFSLLPRLISEGRLDMIITKPVDSQFLVSVQQFSTSIIPSLFGGSTFIVLGFIKLGKTPSPIDILIFLWLLVVATILMYGIYFATVALSLYFDRLDNVYHIFTSLYDASRFPKEIYGIALQRIFTFILPIALMITIPAEALFGKTNLLYILWFHGLAMIFFLLGRHIWTRGLLRYSSASS